MALDTRLNKQLQRVLGVVDDHEVHGPRLLDDAQRLWQRVLSLLKLGVVGQEVQNDALELACYALQLPLRQTRLLPVGRFGRTNLRDRAEQAAELLVGTLGEQTEESLLDRTTRILHELPQRTPVIDEAKLLADAVNIEDFGAVGLIQQVIQVTRQGGGVQQVAEGCEKREQYGYWDARLKDGFHFEPSRQLARRRLETARQICTLLLDELKEDQP